MLQFQEELRNITILKGALSSWLYLNIYLVLTLILRLFPIRVIFFIKLDLHTNGMIMGIQMLKKCQSTLGSWRTGKCYWGKSRGGAVCCLPSTQGSRNTLIPKIISVFNTPFPNLICGDTTLSGYFCSTFLSCLRFHKSKIKSDCPFLALVFP